MDKRIAGLLGTAAALTAVNSRASGDPGRNFGMTSAANNSSEVPWTPAYSQLIYFLG